MTRGEIHCVIVRRADCEDNFPISRKLSAETRRYDDDGDYTPVQRLQLQLLRLQLRHAVSCCRR